MKLNKSFEKGVIIICTLSTQKKNIPISAEIIKDRINPTSFSYLRKIIRKLVIAGIVKSSPGNNGGFTLAKDPKDINLLEIVEALENKLNSYPESNLFKSVFGNLPNGNKGDKVIHKVIKQADLSWSNTLKLYTIQDLLDDVFGKDNNTIDWNNYFRKECE
jgi:Rrf2 family protein